ncbi:DUF3320 domain-containing protein [Geminicoccus harenae]|uniref:DUF3320 domain-containing protein n=1 Tax=Geminicoccus harenae TaxID=2498453 RepID=UPI001C945708|nr:DUF3320 domain-containing protein [Geminicoccus harenae]
MNIPSVELSYSIVDHISLAFHQNAIPVVQEIAVRNTGDTELTDVTVTLTTEPAFLTPTSWQIQAIPGGTTHHLRTPDLKLDVATLLKLVEGIRAEATVVVRQGDVELVRSSKDVRLLPSSHWGGTGAAPELLAAFVRPNDPVVDVILHDAASRLARAGRNSALDGYGSGKKSHVWEVAEAIWNALASRSIRYVYPPTSFERIGQKVRHPSDIVERGVGTCLDLTLSYAACLAQASLNPLLVLIEGHAFVGLWLKGERFPTSVVDDAQLLRKHRDLDEMIFVETTLLTHEPPGRFTAAIQATAAHLAEHTSKPFELAIDVREAWARQIRPLDLGSDTPVTGRPVAAEPAPRELELDVPPVFVEEVSVQPAEDRTLDRLESWKRRLLDLTLRNKLINFKGGKNAIEIECPDPARLEDLLAQGQRFKLLPRTTVLAEGDGRSAALLAERHHDDGRKQFVLEAMGQGVLHTQTPERDLDAYLTDLFRITKTSFEEGGANVLFLALGFLRWKQQEDAPVLRAPLLLIPVRLERSSVRAGFRLSLHEEEARLNPTLLQMLRQDFELRMPELEGDLPADQSGIDVAKIWRIVRHHILPLKGWEVTPEVVLSTFSFTKFLMWKDLVDRVDILKRNPIVRHLIDTPKHAYGDGQGFPCHSDIDRTVHPAELFAPLMADSSQLAAVLAAAAGKDFVLFGPPGTGKSQTITNLIAHCLAQGKKILFVSQKTAALEVVQRRLDSLGLGDFCLEIHSSKAQKSAVLAQLKNAWHERSSLGEGDWRLKADELHEIRQQLNDLVGALHRRHGNGMTAHQAIGKVVASAGRFDPVVLDWSMERELSAEELTTLRRTCRDLSMTLRAIGSPAGHSLEGLAVEEWSPAWRNDMTRAIDDLTRLLAAFPAQIAELARSIDLDDYPVAPAALAALSNLCVALHQPEAAVAWRLLGGHGRPVVSDVEALRRLQGRHAQLVRGLSTGYRPELWTQQDPAALLSEWQAATRASFVTRALRQRGFLRALAAFTDGQPPADPADDLAKLVELKELHRRAEGLAPSLSPLVRGIWAGIDTPIDRLDALVAWATATERAVEQVERHASPSGRLLDRIVADLFRGADPAAGLNQCRDAHERLRTGWQAVQEAAQRVAELANLGSGLPAMGQPDWIDATIALVGRWRGSLGTPAAAWSQWVLAERQARSAGLGPVADAASAGTIAPGEIEAAFEAAHARWWADKVVSEDPVLRRFLPEAHEERITRFRELDEEIRTLSKTIVRARLFGDVPPPTAFGSDPEWGTLSREITKRARHMPLRQLFQKIPTVLTRLAPCVMMSPLSIAQYLPPETELFDIVVFDEASQMAVWDAIGAIARGRQVIVVGDPEQLPPTSVGEKGVDSVDDGSDVTDQESILDECIACNIPRHYLSWHYRSRHESLIAFSNQKYYQGRLVTFPSPVTEDRAVRYVHVPNGVYERGTSRVNREEARAVAADVVRRLKDPGFASGRRSLGIVTFNAEQQRLIENLLDQERRAHPEIEPFFSSEQWHEPVFVKNLENVQGDERDAIIFSVAVGLDADGRVGATISSLNREGGHRRLNVAVTRARRELCVFATLRPEQIDLSRSRARGVHDFKHFLEFAERGPRALAEAFTLTGRGTESPFEEAMKAALEAKGWQVHPQVGVSNFRIDLGIVHPDAPGRYLAGVECDGATYHRSAAARDRDRLREMVLTDLGWTIHRVWSLEWWGDKEAALAKLHDRLSTSLAADRAAQQEAIIVERPPVYAAPAGQPVQVADSLPVEPILPEQPQPMLPAAMRSYVLANPLDCGKPAEPDRFHDPDYLTTLEAMVSHVIEIEGPIFVDVLTVRIARAHGFQRTGGRIRAAVMAAVHDRFPRSEEADRLILWPCGMPPADRVSFRLSEGQRDSADVPFQELVGLAAACLAENAGDVVRRMGQYLQLGKIREATRARLELAILQARTVQGDSRSDREEVASDSIA